MKTTKFLFLLLLPLLFVQGVKGQEYRPFPKENAFWTVLEYDEQFGMVDYSSVRLYTIEGDTTYNGITYNKIYKYYKHKTTGDTLIQLHSLLREDTLQKKVWFVRLFLIETEEKLGYDFSVNLGDTVSLPALEFYEWDVILQDWVLSGDSLFKFENFEIFNDTTRRYFYVSIKEFSENQFEILEGVGCLSFAFPNVKFFYGLSFEVSILSCFSVNNNNIWGFQNGCGFFSYSIHETNLFKAEFFPNPCSEQLHMRFPNPTFEQLSIELISHTGKVIFRDKISNIESYSINTSSLASGLYLLRLTDKQQMQSFKIIVSH
jgi:hypothetical protein